MTLLLSSGVICRLKFTTNVVEVKLFMSYLLEFCFIFISRK